MNLSRKNRIRSIVMIVLIYFFMFSYFNMPVSASETDAVPVPISVDFSFGASEDGQDVVSSIQILVILTIISLAPSILIMVTSFTRILIVLHFIRSALSTQQTPPNQLLVGLALFLTLFIMAPVITEVNEEALQPYSAGEISQQEAIDRGLQPIRAFMLNELKDNQEDLALFMDIANVGPVESYDEIPTEVIIPAFIINEMRAAFIIGFLIYVPFIVIDMVVASTLMSMGMMMLPPVMISMPFKLLLFIMADGWNLIISELVKTFYD